MARVSRQQTAQHREELVEASSRLFRERGLNGTSIADLTAAVGLTHGGFYGHFASKDELAAEACQRAFDHTDEKWRSHIAAAPDAGAALAAIIAGYINPEHRDTPGPGCAASSLCGDIGREAPDKPVRESFSQGIECLIAHLAALIARTPDGDEARDRAILLLSSLTGAIALARATAGRPLSDEILTAVRRQLAAPPVSAG
jgi:TetR/AcrR family transcriptional repressor of nem operon